LKLHRLQLLKLLRELLHSLKDIEEEEILLIKTQTPLPCMMMVMFILIKPDH
jgi:hypothetical protein